MCVASNLRRHRRDTAAALSDGHLDGVTVSESRVDAVFTNLKLRNSRKLTLSQHHAGSTKSVGSGSATEGTVAWLSHVLLKATNTLPRS